MNPDSSPAVTSAPQRGRLESIAFYLFIATIIISPLAFWSSPYVALDLVKTFVIAMGTLFSAILLGLVAINERRMILPPKSVSTLSVLLIASMLVSAITSIHFMKSFIGQGFEIGTAGFQIALFLAGLVAFTLVARRHERSFLIYAALTSAYLVLFVFQILRFILGPSFATLSILNSVTSTVLGSWSNFGIYSGFVAVISLVAILTLPLSRKMQVFYTILKLLAAIGIFLSYNPGIWLVLALISFGLTAVFTYTRPKVGNGISGFMKRLAWVPLIITIVLLVLAFTEGKLAGDFLTSHNAVSSELSLPWQMTLDVTAGAIKNYPVFGVGPNHFTQAYLAYKPAGVNQSDAWGIEFGTGFGLIPTFITAQGLVGAILWTLFFVFYLIIGVRALKSTYSDTQERFTIMSSFVGSLFLWIMAVFALPLHVLMFFTLALTGVFLGSLVAYGKVKSVVLAPTAGSASYKFMPSLLCLAVLVVVVWGLVYVKKTVALVYFASGVKQLTTGGNPQLADAKFAKALAIDSSDIYWQARAEAALSDAGHLSATLNAQTPASTSQAVVGDITSDVKAALIFSKNAIAYDPTNYYNYVSEGRVSEAANNIKLQGAYDEAVQAYSRAIALNPYNPSLYLTLARLQATQNNLDDAVRTIGAALQVKNNYLDAIFLLSQVDAAKGNLPEAITAAQYSIQINPTNPIFYFQLGLLQYNSKNYSAAADAMSQAVKIQPDYANAQYFLGLSDARLGNNSGAVAQFAELAKSNPDNQEVRLVLANLQAGKPIFADAIPPVTPNPEKRSNLPINQKQ